MSHLSNRCGAELHMTTLAAMQEARYAQNHLQEQYSIAHAVVVRMHDHYLSC